MSVFIIAEVGVNHNGSLELAKQLVDVAKDCGADAVKFQTFKAATLVTKAAKQADYQTTNTGKQESQFDMLKRLELSEEDHQELVVHCQQQQIEFMSTPFDLQSIQFLNGLGVERFKIPSGEITNYPYLKMVGAYNKEIVLSTGMATLSDIEAALNLLIDSGTDKDKITILHATTDYPTQMQDVNLTAMQTIAQAFKVKVGYSDHTPGIEVPTAAVALGASIIEKHFTLDKNLPGPDHKASLEPDELKAMVKAIRNIEVALGDGIKRPSVSEQKNMQVARKSLIALTDIKKGDVFSEQNLTVKRPGLGISPMRWNEIIGKVAQKDYQADELI
ncbi:MAG: N-acetylneuraminate synthase [Shewanella sp. CG18_big_fil_WC_8_21_14_2_50_42_11]|uniref:N-acetylneuraminate synthase n=1 Tax=Shewanella sp. CG18_big_fil_WC_8_21_14_2_50_42_11 TaxID=1975538 RepID=UPI000C4EA41C|nr:N-acetylneuraminate synthase [Shewanella sp. CG18_big_fil_WC_8_21_14_2_50_42_11]PIP98575.1 MAG: N-acetylneuraminate synthase [Shewanella sp. CG18_big_fil_WC_8_21_14_2_50_42_11]